MHDILYSKVKTIPTVNEWIEVESSFGGLAIYKKKCFYKNEYVGLYNNGEEICEHVHFNQKLRNNGLKLFINPRLINAKHTEHTEHMEVQQKALGACSVAERLAPPGRQQSVAPQRPTLLLQKLFVSSSRTNFFGTPGAREC